MNKRKFIIFGSNGFIGNHFVNYIEKNQLGEVIKFDIELDKRQDVRKDIIIDGDFSSDDVIINLAAVHTTPGHPDNEYFETNILGAEMICKFAEEKGINNIFFTSSIAPYGASESLKTEKTLPMPNTPYGISKLVAEHIHKIWHAKDSCKRRLIVVRPGVVFGKGEGGNYTRLYAALSKGRFFYPGRKDTLKACIYVKDLVEAGMELIYKQTGGVELYNFCYPKAPAIKTIVNEICKVTGINPPNFIVNGKLLMFLASIIGSLGGKKFGIHPDRVKKLMISTNISGEKLEEQGIIFKYGITGGLKDWYENCTKTGLY